MIDMDAAEERMLPVYQNRRVVGEIPEAEWMALSSYVSTNGVIWEAQMKNLLRVAARLVGFGFISVPLGVFWTAVMLGWVGKPIEIGGPGWHVGMLLSHPQLVAAGIALAVGSMMALGLKLGYVNYFAKARSALLREHLNIDEPGQCGVR
jgi:hypothetical protein